MSVITAGASAFPMVIYDQASLNNIEQDMTAPAAPINLSATAGGDSILLSWDDNTENDFAAYNIYRSTIQCSYGALMDTVTVSHYVDRTVTGGATYYYVITAVDAVGNESGNSNEIVAPAYKGDLTIDGRVDMKDFAVLSSGWQTIYDMITLRDVVCDWLSTSALYNGGNTYYVDNAEGDDINTGLTSQQPWKTLSKVNSVVFEPGDEILFKAGTTYVGQLKPQGSGEENWPIIVDQYGIGSKPLIDGTGWLAAVHLEGLQHWEVNNMEVINNAGTAMETEAETKRYGVYLRADKTGTRRHITLRDLYIHDIFATGVEHGVGVGIESDGEEEKTNYEEILIENCHIETTSTHGIWLHHKNWWHPNPIFTYNENIIIRNNVLENIGGTGFQPNHCKQMLIENNTVESGQPGSNQKGRGSGFWNWHCEDVTVQFNTFMHARGEGDSCGAHVDIGNINTTIQYNLSYDNAGGFVEILGDSYNTIYRYNISINDGWRIKGVDGASQHGHMLWLGGWTGSGSPNRGPFNSHIYNNTIYLAPGLTTRILLEDTAQDAYFRNNIFYADGTVVDENPDSAALNVNFDYNLYIELFPATLPEETKGIIADPLLVNPGGLTTMDYMLLSGSPAINAGMTIPDNGGWDYWGNPLLNATEIGAHEKE